LMGGLILSWLNFMKFRANRSSPAAACTSRDDCRRRRVGTMDELKEGPEARPATV
jgi:hypothetical protein